MLGAERPPTSALRPPVAVGPADEEDDFAPSYEGSYPSKPAGGGWGDPSHGGSAGVDAWSSDPIYSGGDDGRGCSGGGWGIERESTSWGGGGWGADSGTFDTGLSGVGGGVDTGFDLPCASRPSNGGWGIAGENGLGAPIGDRPTRNRVFGTNGSQIHASNKLGASGASYYSEPVEAMQDDWDLAPYSSATPSRGPKIHSGPAALKVTPGESRHTFAAHKPGRSLPPVMAKVLNEVQPGQVRLGLVPGYRQEPRAASRASLAGVQPPTVPVLQGQGLGMPAVVQMGLPLTAAMPVPALAQPLTVAERWVTSYAPLPVLRTPTLTYPSGAYVNFQEFSKVLAPVAAVNAAHRARIIPAIESGDLVRQTLQTYTACDKDLTGFLSWNNGEIRNFIASVFQQHGLSPPNEQQMYQLYSKFDADRNSVLDARECLCMVDALFRSIFFTDTQHQQGFVAGPSAAVSPLQALRAPQHHVLPPMGVLHPPSPTVYGGLHPPSGALGQQPLSISVPPAPVPLPPMSYGIPPSSFGTGFSNATTIPDQAMPSFHIPPYAAFMSPSVPPSAKGIGSPGAQLRPPPVAPPKPPAWQHEHEKRPHLIEVELNELELLPAAPDLEASWYHSVRYFVSLHPRSEHPDNIPLPRDPPKKTIEGQYLVSQIQPPRKSKVKVGARRGGDGDGSGSDGDNPVVEFGEHLALGMDRLDQYLVAYIWGKKSSMVDESVTLVGRSLAPLHEFHLQRRSTTWGVFDVLEGHRVADMRLRYAVATTPGPVLDPVLAEAHQTEVKITWTPPKNDHGAPVLGYKVAIMLEQNVNEGPRWFTLCECTKTLNPVYVVANLQGNRVYMVDVRAVNKVGVGDPCEFQAATAPVEPDPPSKPWIEEARDGCVNVAWLPPPSDGGCPVTAYKVRMRKLLGASKWNPFGPGESKAVWVDMGTVGAVLGEQEDGASMYNAWLGPLESTACEYKFQITALTAAGESQGSELSSPIYT